MSEQDTFWISVGEKLFGLILLIIGAILVYFTATSTELGVFIVFFGVLGVIILGLGVALLLFKPPE
jgi:hypothetical protein